jgi:L-rhamnonate dehydratase
MGGGVSTRVARIEWARLEGQRPRKAGCNARLSEHGQRVRPPIARITTDEEMSGFGWAWVTEDQARELIGLPLDDAFDPETGVREPFRLLEYAILDLVGKQAGKPVYALLDGEAGREGTLCAACYDTSLYMDDLHLQDDDAAAALMAAEAMEGYDRGHRSFKIKVGRGAMHMPLEAGTRRDIRVVRAVREAVGPEARIMVDANNGYNVNLVKRVLGETADAKVYWIEEAFHEDARLYGHLREWMSREGIETLIADGEGSASPHLLEWATQGVIDVVQYDVLRPGFSRWLELGPELDAAGVRSAPHHYGEPYGNYAGSHLAAGIHNFEGAEWDEATVPGLDASAYAIKEGKVAVPSLPGFGLFLDDEAYAEVVRNNGFAVTCG